MINLNSPIKPPLMISEGKQAVPGKDFSCLSETPIWGQSDLLYRSLSPSINSLQAKETLNSLILPHLQLPMEGNLRSAETRSLGEECMSLQHKLAASSYIRNLGTQLCFIRSSASCHEFGSI